jgi:hypothetical protein
VSWYPDRPTLNVSVFCHITQLAPQLVNVSVAVPKVCALAVPTEANDINTNSNANDKTFIDILLDSQLPAFPPSDSGHRLPD